MTPGGSAGAAAVGVSTDFGPNPHAVRWTAPIAITDGATRFEVSDTQKKLGALHVHVGKVVSGVLKKGADVGLAWDGDYDRCFFFDEQGTFIEGYYLVGLLAEVFGEMGQAGGGFLQPLLGLFLALALEGQPVAHQGFKSLGALGLGLGQCAQTRQPDLVRGGLGGVGGFAGFVR